MLDENSALPIVDLVLRYGNKPIAEQNKLLLHLTLEIHTGK